VSSLKDGSITAKNEDGFSFKKTTPFTPQILELMQSAVF